MKLYQKFLTRLYLKKILLLFIALELFFIGFDLLKNFKRLPDSANLQILYTVNKFLEYIGFTIPLALVFALMLAMLQIIKTNELVSLYALGISKKAVVKPFVLIASGLTLIYILLNTLPYFAQSHETAANIKKRGSVNAVTSSIFIKSGNDYAYIEKLDPHARTGTDMKIFKTDGVTLQKWFFAKNGKFVDNHWELHNVTVYEIPKTDQKYNPDAKLKIETYPVQKVLYGFKPHIIDTLFQTSPKLTIQDSLFAIDLLSKQGLKTEKIRARLYMMTVYPFFAPLIVFGLFFLFPVQHRGANLSLFTTVAVFGTLVLWGIIFTMTKIASNGAILPEAGIILPILILAIVSFLIYRKYR